jgi:glutathione S-transferase
MKLYEFAPSPSARRVTIFAKEIGLDLESVAVDIRGGENLTEQFLGKSLNGRVPVLELDDGSHLCESVAICRFLEATKTDSKSSLFGNSALDQATIEMWHRMVEFQGLFPAMQAFRNITGLYKDRENVVPEWGIESKKRVISFFPVLDKQLAKSTYIAGDKFTVADISAVVMLNICEKIEIQIPDELTHLTNWYESTSTRNCFQL